MRYKKRHNLLIPFYLVLLIIIYLYGPKYLFILLILHLTVIFQAKIMVILTVSESIFDFPAWLTF